MYYEKRMDVIGDRNFDFIRYVPFGLYGKLDGFIKTAVVERQHSYAYLLE